MGPYTATDISIEMTSPSTPGMYESKWRMSTATGNFFGEIIWVIISVEVAGTLAITQQFSKLDQLGSRSEGQAPSPEFNPFRSPTRSGLGSRTRRWNNIQILYFVPSFVFRFVLLFVLSTQKKFWGVKKKKKKKKKK